MQASSTAFAFAKQRRFRYKNNNMEDLKAQLEAAKDCRIKVIATDGVFSMDGFIANLPQSAISRMNTAHL